MNYSEFEKLIVEFNNSLIWDIEYYIAKHHKKFIQNIVITLYKEIAEDNCKAYNNEQ